MTRRMLRKCLIASFLCLGASSCSHDLGIKVYRSDTKLGGLYRDQNKELIKYEDSTGMFCTNEEGMRKLVEALSLCKDLQN